MNVFTKLADLLDTLADEWPKSTPVQEKTASTPEPQPADEIASRYKAATGEDLPSEIRSKIAEDPDLASALSKIAAVAPSSLGEPSDRKDDAAPLSKAARREDAWERFGTQITERTLG